MQTWHIPKLWSGTVAVLGSGQSLTPQAATLAVRSVPTIVINSTYELAPRSSMLYGADEAWWHANPSALSFAGLKVSVGRVKGVHHIRNAGVVGYTDADDAVFTYGNSGSQAIQIAAKAGASRILLLGFDMHGGHWHPEHKKPLVSTEPETYTKWIGRFDRLARELKKRGVEVLNCTEGSELKWFPFSELSSALETRAQSAA